MGKGGGLYAHSSQGYCRYPFQDLSEQLALYPLLQHVAFMVCSVVFDESLVAFTV